MNFINTIKAFFRTPNVDSVAVTIRAAFIAASDAYDAAFLAIEAYTSRANHRFTIRRAIDALHESSLDDPHAADAYDNAVAAYKDPADFEPYTETYLDAHTAALDTLTAAFDTITAAFAVFNPADELYASAAALYKATCQAYTLSATAYSNAAYCAMTTALEGNIQAIKDDLTGMLLETSAANATADNSVTAKAKAAAFEAKTAEEATKAKAFLQKAKLVETKAEIFLAKAESAQLKAEEAL